jgi:hypothetical protein
MYIPDIRPNVQLYQPNNWNPTTMPLCEINLPTFSEVHNQGLNGNINVNMTGQTQPIKGGMTNTSQGQAYPFNQDGMTMTTQTQPVNIVGGMTTQTNAIKY